MIPVNEPLLDGNERKYLLQCLDTGWISSEGPFIRQFEERFAARVGERVVRALVGLPRRLLGLQVSHAGQALGLGVPLAGRRGPEDMLALAHHPHEVVGSRAALADEHEDGEGERGEFLRGL